MAQLLYVDLRCLQEYGYRVRGIGHHVAALLRTRAHSTFANWKTIGLIDPKSPNLPTECSSLVDEVSASLNPCCNGAPAVFVDGTPMTHDTRFSVRFVGNPGILSAAAVYDFIPLDWPGYLPRVAQRIEYFAKMARLRKFDYFLPISDYTAWRLSDFLGIPQEKMRVTGASVRDSLYKFRDRASVPFSANGRRRPYFLMVVGPDRRKNPEVVVKALRHLNLLYSGSISLKIAGHFEQAYRDALLELAGHREGEGFLDFCFNVPDEELAILFGGAVATIVPSHIEGFSLPIVEASVCGCPVIASTCAAHFELIDQPEALFPSSDATVLAQKLEAVLNDEPLRASLIASQSQLGAKFHEDAVGRRFWSALQAAVEDRYRPVPAFVAKKKPRLAFLSCYPPEQSEAAFYTAMTMQAGATIFDSDLYTNSRRPLQFDGKFKDAGEISVTPLLGGHYNGIISVLGNSASHVRSFEFFERYGGPCILHDARLTQIYFQRLGQEKFLQFASRILGRSVSVEEMDSWLKDDRPSSLLLERVLERASPLIVQTVTQQALIRQRYGVDAQVTTCCPATFFREDELLSSSRRAVRDRLGIASSVFVMSNFECTARSKSTDTCIVAADLLRSWKIPVELYLIGIAKTDIQEIESISTRYGIHDYVHCITAGEDRAVRRDFLLASDAGIQLRSYEFGAVSTVLSDCISAGLPSVATIDMAKSTDAPAYIAAVPDHFSPLHVAEQIAMIWDSKQERSACEAVRTTYLQTHNFSSYVERLSEILGVA